MCYICYEHTCVIILLSLFFSEKIVFSVVMIEMSKIKQQKHIATAQKQLQKAKERSQKYVPGTINLQILGNGAKGAPSSVYLFTDQSRYVFYFNYCH